jgi:glycosyltransferase involved in cell wall biosynthesis
VHSIEVDVYRDTPSRNEGTAALAAVPTGPFPRFADARANGARLAGEPGSNTAPLVSVVIPTLNEADNLHHVLPRLAPEYEVVIVDGASTDGTIDVALELRPDAVVVEQEGRGKGDALVQGFRAAAGEIIVTLDADGSADSDEIPRFVEALLEGADFAKGSRYLEGGGSDDLTFLRSAGNRLLGGVTNLLYGTAYTDLCYGYNAFRRDCVPHLQGVGTGFEIETLMHVRAVNAGLKVVEVPSHESRRRFGNSNLRPFRDGFRILSVIVRERRRLGREQAAATRAVPPHAEPELHSVAP